MRVKWLHKLAALVLALVLIAGLAACAGGGGDAAATPTPAPPASGGDTATPAPSGGDTPPTATGGEELAAKYVKDLGGREIKFYCWWDYLEGFQIPGAAEPDPGESTNYAIDMMRWEHYQGVWGDYNCTGTNVTVGWDEYMPTLTTSVMSGDPAGDIAMMHSSWILNGILGNVYIPLDDILPPTHDIFTSKTHLLPGSEVGGKTWTAYTRQVEYDGSFLGVNRDIIRAEGCPDPGELYDSGQWTWDAFMDIARRCTRDTTNDGIIDQWGLGGGAGDILKGLMASNGVSPVTEDFKYGFDSPQSMQALDAMYQILAIDKAWAQDDAHDLWDWGYHDNQLFDGNVAMFVVGGTYKMRDLHDMNIYSAYAVPFPKGPQYDGHTFYTSFKQSMAMPRGVKDPEDVFAVWENFVRWYGDDIELLLDEDRAWGYSIYDSEHEADRIMDALATQGKFDLCSAVSMDGRVYDWIFGDFCWPLYNDEKTPAQLVEELRPVNQDMLDTVLGSIR